jgi:imidazolonepropionase
MGAHTIPAEYKDKRKKYIELVIKEMIPKVAEEELALFCDVFVEETAIQFDEAEAVLQAGLDHSMKPKVHADQLTSGHGSELAGRMNAVSADHLECINKVGMQALIKSGTIAVSLPIATLYMNQRPLPARELIRQGIPVAVATDFNPGTAPSYHLPYAMHLGCVLQRMTPDEVLKGATLYAAKAIDQAQHRGSIAVGKTADFTILDVPDVAHWFYHFRQNVCEQTWISGEKVWDAQEHYIASSPVQP